MANPGHLEILKQGVEQWNKWRRENRDLEPDLSAANLAEADLRGANLREVDFRVANLRGANLHRAKLGGANLSMAILVDARLDWADLNGADLVGADLNIANLWGADLSLANLSRADLSLAHLSGANLTRTVLWHTNLSGANLEGADFTEAAAEFTNFASVDLSVTKGLETVGHNGPSPIGIYTIYMSRGKIPEVFLRGCGVPDEFIAYIGSMVGRPIEFYSCFISYSSKDQEFAERLYSDLKSKGVRCWFAPEELKIGDRFQERIEESIRPLRQAGDHFVGGLGAEPLGRARGECCTRARGARRPPGAFPGAN